jgi:hypothetical protein
MERVLVGLLFGLACAEAALSQAPPGWVVRRPAAPGYLVGIGVTRTEGDLPAARKAAAQQALGDIALQLEARVSSQARLEVEEGGEGMNQEYRSEIRTQTAGELEGVEIAGTYEDGEHCWVYARLSVEEFHRRRQERAAQARQEALALFARAQGQAPAAALALYLQALAPLQRAAGDPLHAEYQGLSLDLATEIPLRLQQLLSTLRLEAAPGQLRLRQRALLDQVLEVRARGKEGPVAGLPLGWRFVQGEGQLVQASLTDQEGMARSRLRQVKAAQRFQQIEARPDLAALLAPESRVMVAPLLAGYALPRAVFSLQVEPEAIWVKGGEDLGLDAVVRAYLEGQGQPLAALPGQADLVVEIRTRARQGAQWRELYFAYLDLELALRDRRTGEELGTAVLNQVKGAGPDYPQAQAMASARAGRQLEEQVLPELLTKLNR